MKEPAEAGRPLADAIAAETRRRDLTQEEAAKLIGTTQQTMGKWMNGITRPSDDHMAALAGYLGMTEAKVRELRGPMRTDPRERQGLRRRVEVLERDLESLRNRLDEMARRVGRRPRA